MDRSKLLFRKKPDTIFPLLPTEIEFLIRSFWPATGHIGDFGDVYINDHSCFFCGFRLRKKMIDTRLAILENYICGSPTFYTCSQSCHVKAEPIQYYFFAPASMDPFQKLWDAVDCFYGAISYEELDDWKDIMCRLDLIQMIWDDDDDEYHDNDFIDDDNYYNNMNHYLIDFNA